MIIKRTRSKQSDRNWRPHGYQKKAVKFLLSNSAAALFLDPGLGKTSIVLGAFKILKREKLSQRMLVIAPLRVCYSVWPAEVEKWDDFHGLSVTTLHGPHKESNLNHSFDVYVINPEGLPWLAKDGRMKKLLDKGVDTLVVDELSKFKHTNTKRFKTLKPFLAKFARRWGLTGSPAANGLMDLFGQAYVLDQGRTFGPYITRFRNEYFYPSGYGGYQWQLKESAEERIYERLRPLALRMAAEDYLDLPTQIDNVIKVEIPDKAWYTYCAMEDEALSILDDQTIVTAVNAASITNKCRQIANGALYLEQEFDEELGAPIGKREWRHMHDAKLDALVDLIEELQGSPILVAYEYKHDLERILERLGKDTPYIGGGVSSKKAAVIQDKWNRGIVPVLLGQPQSIGHGLNLQGAGVHNVCWFGLTWNYELYDQFIRRVLRQGSEADHVMVHHIVAEETVDELILDMLGQKKKRQDNLLTALKKYRRTRGV